DDATVGAAPDAVAVVVEIADGKLYVGHGTTPTSRTRIGLRKSRAHDRRDARHSRAHPNLREWRRPNFALSRGIFVTDTLRLVEAEINKIRNLLYTRNQASALMVDSPIHRKLDKLIALHAQ